MKEDKKKKSDDGKKNKRIFHIFDKLPDRERDQETRDTVKYIFRGLYLAYVTSNFFDISLQTFLIYSH